MAQKKFIIAADIELTSPMHITAINKGAYMMPDGEAPYILRYEPSGKSSPQCSLTRTMQIFAGSGDTDATKKAPRVPVIPASTFAGKLRRAAAELMFDSMISRNKQVSPDTYNMLTTGTASTSIATAASIPEVVRAARNDPFLHLFGGTTFMISSASVISEGWPLLDVTRGLMMTEPILPTASISKLEDMTDAVAIIRKNDVLDMRGEQLQSVITLSDLAAYFTKESEDRKATKQRRSEGEAGPKTSLRAINAYEAIRPGMAFALRIEVTARTPASLGLMLMAVQRLLREGQIGGKTARGLGRFTLAPNASRLYELDPENRQTIVLSSIFENKASGYKFADNPIIAIAVTAAQDFIDECDPKLYEKFKDANAQGIKAMQKELAAA